MLKIQLVIFSVCLITLTGCERITNLLNKQDLKGVYKDNKGRSMEFTETMVSLDLFGTFPYKVEGKYVYIENIKILDANFGTAKLEIIDANTIANTIKILNKGLSSEEALLTKEK